MSRLSMSRPSSSVPSQCAADGPWRALATFWMAYGYGATTSAKMAVSSRSANTASPNRARRLWASWRQANRHGPADRARPSPSNREDRLSPPNARDRPSPIADARVQADVGQVYHQIDQGHHGRHQQRHAHQHRIVT